MINFDALHIVTHDTKQRVTFSESVTSLSVNYEINGASQLTVKVLDFNMEMWNNNYFQIETLVIFKGEEFEIASTEINQGEGEYVEITLEMRTRAVQKMRRNKNPHLSYRSTNGFEFAQKVAKGFGLKFVGEKALGVKQSTIKVKSQNNKDSVWDVLQRAASDVQYMCFVADGTLFFGSPKKLLGKWGKYSVGSATLDGATGKPKEIWYVPLEYPSDPTSAYFLLQIPNLRRSEDSPKESEGEASLWGGEGYGEANGNAYDLRPGMTVIPYGVKGFIHAYLITSVKYQYGEPEPVSIAFATVDKLAPADQAKIDKKVGEVTVISGGGG